MKRTYIDSGVLIAAIRGIDPIAQNMKKSKARHKHMYLKDDTLRKNYELPHKKKKAGSLT